MQEPKRSKDNSPKIETNLPMVADWRKWAGEDDPDLGDDILQHHRAPFRELFASARMPNDEYGCMEVIAGCMECDMPTVLHHFLLHSTVDIRTLRISFPEPYVGFPTTALSRRMAAELVESVLRPRGKDLEAIELAHLKPPQEALQTLCHGLSECSALKVARFIGCRLNPPQVESLIKSLENSIQTLTELNLEKSKLEDKASIVISLLKQKLKNPISLVLKDCRLSAFDAEVIALALADNIKLERLDLSDNNFADNGGQKILDSLPGKSNLKELSLEDCNLGEKCATTLPKMLRHTSLTSLSIGFNRELVLSHDFTEALQASTTLKILSVKAAGNVPGCIAAIARALKENVSLVELNISYSNVMEAEDLNSLVEGLGSSKILCLKMSMMTLKDHDCERLLVALTKNQKLEILKLDDNELGKSACAAAANLLKTSKCLSILSLRACAVDDAGLMTLCQGLSKNRSLRHLNLAINMIGNDGLCLLRSALEGNSSLIGLEVRGNRFETSKAWETFHAVLQKNASLTAIDYDKLVESKRLDWVVLNSRLWANAKLNNPSTQKYLAELVKRFVVFKVRVEDLGKRLWETLRDSKDPGEEFAKLRSVLRLAEVNRTIAYARIILQEPDDESKPNKLTAKPSPAAPTGAKRQ